MTDHPDHLAGATWRKSTRSQGANACVEIARIVAHAGLRDSKHPTGPAVTVPAAAFAALLDEIRG